MEEYVSFYKDQLFRHLKWKNFSGPNLKKINTGFSKIIMNGIPWGKIDKIEALDSKFARVIDYKNRIAKSRSEIEGKNREIKRRL